MKYISVFKKVYKGFGDREGLTESGTFEQRFEGTKGANTKYI